MPMRRESGRASGTGRPKRKQAPTGRRVRRTERDPQQSSLGSNAAAAHGYTRKTPTRTIRRVQAKEERGTRQVLRPRAAPSTANEARIQASTSARIAAREAREIQAKRKESERHTSFLRRLVRSAEGAASANPIVRALSSSPPKVLDRELKGTGHLVKESAKLADLVQRKGFTVSTGAGPNIAGTVATRGRKQKRGGRPIAAIQPRKVAVKDMPKVAQNAIKDAINAPAQALPSLVVPVSAAAKATRGDTAELKKYAKDIEKNDPVYAAATGNFKKAGRLAKEHPGFTAAEVVGGARALDRGIGRVVRATGRVTGSKRVQAAGATHTRPDATVPGTGMREVRTYSRGVVGKRVNVARDKARTRKADKLRAQADRVAKTDVDAADRLRERAAKTDPLIMSAAKQKEYVDLQEAAGERARRRNVQERDVQVTKLVKRGGGERGGAALNLTVQGITKASVKDLRAYRDELARAAEGLVDSDKLRANRKLRQEIDRSIKRADRGGRVRGLDLEKVQEVAREYSRDVDVPLDKRLADLKILPRERGERAKLLPNAVRQGKATVTDAGIVDAEGRVIPTARLRELAEERGATPSYISQGPNARGARNYYVASAREPVIPGRARTGQATLEGTSDSHPETVRASALRRENIAQAAENFRKELGDAAVRDRGGDVRPVPYAVAMKQARNLTASTGERYVPVSFEPWALTREHREGMLAGINEDSPRAAQHLFSSVQQALDPKNAGQHTSGSFVVVSETSARRMSQHASVLNPNDFENIAQAFRGGFSRTVLSVSPSPTIGNFVEAGVRTTVSRAGPISAYTMYRTFKKMTPAEKQEFQDRVFGAGPVTLRAQSRHFEPGQLSDGAAKDIARGWESVKRAPVSKQVVGAWHQWNHFITRWLNGKIEKTAQYAMAGKAIRDSGLMGESILRLSDKAMEQAARGVQGTAEQNMLAKAVIRDFGKYDGFSPAQRRLIANYTPFLAWWMSAARFVGMMPLERPLMTALLAANERATTDWQELKGTQDWLRGTAVIGKTRWQVSRNTPFGAFSDPVGTFGQLILPQIVPAIYNSGGLDWKGDPLRNEDGSPFTQQQRAKQILLTMLESSVPLYAVPDRAIDFTKNPSKLLNPIRVRPSSTSTGGGGAIPPSEPSGPTTQLPSAPALPSGGGQYRLP